jgi:hypothetical protein
MKRLYFKSYSVIPVTALILTVTVFMSSFIMAGEKKAAEKGVRFVRIDDKHKVDVFINGIYFTSYCYPPNIEKPFLFPVIAPDGAVITRGFPLEPRRGERVDHPHHIGIWFNHGDVNGLDFWNNSSAIAADKKDGYGHIVNRQIIRADSGKTGVLEVFTSWEDNKGNILLKENARYFFSGESNSRTIDHISVLTAISGDITIGDSKEGLFAIRVDRAFEMPSGESLIFTDSEGNPTKVPAIDNTGVTGMYISSQGFKGDAVWGTRNEWVILSGVKNSVPVSIAMFDNPKNIGFPAYAHARGYGLFSLNNLGQNSYDPKKEKVNLRIEKGKSVTFYHRFYVQSGSELTPEQADGIFREFVKAN